MKKKKILMLVCMAVLAVTVVIPVNAAKKTNKKQIQVLNLYQDQKTDIEEAEYLVSYLEDKNIDEESVEKQEKEEKCCCNSFVNGFYINCYLRINYGH